MATTIFLVNPQTFPSSTSYLLDTYTAAAAYSLRQLKTGVTSVVRVRRSSDNAESDFTATEITDGTLASWVGANNGFVTKLYEQSGSGKSDIVNTVAGQQPKLVNAGTVYTDTNGLPYIVFDGIDDDLITNAGFMPATVTDWWSFSALHNQQILITKDVGASTYGWLVVADTGSNVDATYTVQGGTQYNAISSPITTGGKLLTTKYDRGSEIRAYVNGTSVASAVVPATDLRTTTGLVQVGASAVNGHNNSELYELIFFDTDESANRTDIESDINTHYSIY